VSAINNAPGARTPARPEAVAAAPTPRTHPAGPDRVQVFDYRRDLQNLAVRPEGRSRFRRVELGTVPPMHSHDLVAETFLVLESQIEFDVEDESVVCQLGQLIVVPPRIRHAVRAVGEEPGAIYLNEAPHVEPTHTF
jgi:quercetin dioxygenase-like cupin family protein